MEGKFTDKAKQVLNDAIGIAESYGHTYIGSEHLLIALTVSEGSCAHVILKKHKITRERLDRAVREYSGIGTRSELCARDTTPRCKRILESSYRNSRKFSSERIGTEHLLLSLLEERESVAVRILLRTDADVSGIKEDLISFMRTAEKSISGVQKVDLSIPNLMKYGKNLTALAASDVFDPVIGREKETERLIRILTRKNKNNPCLLGEAGVGKTAIVEGLAQRIVTGRVPPPLLGRTIISLDLTSMVAGAKYRGDFEERIKSVMDEAAKNKSVILFIDELHTIVGAGSAEGAIDAANIMKPELSRGDIRIIGATTLDEYRRYIEKDGALERRFQPITVEEPTQNGAIDILTGIKKSYEKHHGIRISESAIIAAVKLSSRYIQDRYLPDKAIDLLDEACAKVIVSGASRDDKIYNTEEISGQNVANDGREISTEHADGGSIRLEKQKFFSSDTALESLRLDGAYCPTVTEMDVREVLSEITGISLVPTTENVPHDVQERLSERIIGQDKAIRALSSAVMRSEAGINDPGRPRGIFLFLGESGVGKSETARALAEVLFGEADSLIEYDMSEYSESYSVSKLIGSAPGYVGYGESKSALEAVRRRPYSVILLDEVEKAHPDVTALFLQIFDKGVITDASGKRINFRNSYIIMTSNLCADRADAPGFLAGRGTDDLRQRLKPYFKQELINRIDEIILFSPPDVSELATIAEKKLSLLAARAEEREIFLNIEDSVPHLLAVEGKSRGFGARPMLRLIAQRLEAPLSDMIVTGAVKSGDEVKATIENGKIILSITQRKDEECATHTQAAGSI